MQGRSFACLPKLEDLRIDAALPDGGDEHMSDESIQVELAGLPAGLKTLEVGTAAKCVGAATRCHA